MDFGKHLSFSPVIFFHLLIKLLSSSISTLYYGRLKNVVILILGGLTWKELGGLEVLMLNSWIMGAILYSHIALTCTNQHKSHCHNSFHVLSFQEPHHKQKGTLDCTDSEHLISACISQKHSLSMSCPYGRPSTQSGPKPSEWGAPIPPNCEIVWICFHFLPQGLSPYIRGKRIWGLQKAKESVKGLYLNQYHEESAYGSKGPLLKKGTEHEVKKVKWLPLLAKL